MSQKTCLYDAAARVDTGPGGSDTAVKTGRAFSFWGDVRPVSCFGGGVYVQTFFEDLNTLMYPSALLHTFGVNGKVSGSVGAVGEMGGGVMAILHGPRGCGFHYRHSARRRHQPFYPLLCSDLTEREIIYGGAEKLERTARAAWERYHPQLLMLIPTPVSDILNEDLRAVADALRTDGIRVAAVQSELFSHRDKNYSRARVRELAKQKITGDGRLEMELKGCGFTEALYALVDQVMEPAPAEPRTVNIETVGWGSEGQRALYEIADFLADCGIGVHCWIPSAPVDRLITAPAAQLNLVKRVRWARRMKERFGTEYLHLGGAGRYTGLSGIATFFRDIGDKLGMAQEMEPMVLRAMEESLAQTSAARAELARHPCVLVSRGIQAAPLRIKLYAKEFGLPLTHVCLILTPDMRREMALTPELEASLLQRVQDAAALYAGGVPITLNPDRETLRRIFAEADAVVGTNDFTLEGLGAPVIPAMSETTSFSFPSYVRNVLRLRERLEAAQERDTLLLSRMPFDREHWPLYAGRESLAAKEMWERMWLYRKEDER